MIAFRALRALGIDTSTHVATVALVDGETTVACESNEDARRHAEAIVGLIDRAFASAGFGKDEIDVVACGLGPGSFTGIRVGLSTAKGIALGLARPIVGIGSLEAMASAVRARPDDIIVPMLDAKKDEVFWAAYDSAGNLVAGPSHVRTADMSGVVATFGEHALLAGELAPMLGLGPLRIAHEEGSFLPRAIEVARLGMSKLAIHGADDLHALEPVYVRPPDITMPRPAPPRDAR